MGGHDPRLRLICTKSLLSIHQPGATQDEDGGVSAYGVALLVWLLGSLPMALLVGLVMRRSRHAPTVIDLLAAEAAAEAERITASAAFQT